MRRVETADLVTDTAGLLRSAGNSLGPTEWTPIPQQGVHAFARVTGDHNFRHAIMEVQDARRPAVVAESRIRFYS